MASPATKTRELSSMVLEPPTTAKGWSWKLEETAKRWWTGSMVMQSKATPFCTVAGVQKHMREWWSRSTDLRRRVADWRVHISANITRKPTLGQEEAPGVEKRSGSTFLMWYGRGHGNVRVLGWNLARWRLWCRYADQGFHANSGSVDGKFS